MAPAGAEYVVSTWATWMAGGYIPSMLYLECIWCGVAVPLATASPPPELEAPFPRIPAKARQTLQSNPEDRQLT
eukprot:802505-Pyramimonas_sp.AAC.1